MPKRRKGGRGGARRGRARPWWMDGPACYERMEGAASRPGLPARRRRPAKRQEGGARALREEGLARQPLPPKRAKELAEKLGVPPRFFTKASGYLSEIWRKTARGEPLSKKDIACWRHGHLTVQRVEYHLPARPGERYKYLVRWLPTQPELNDFLAAYLAAPSREARVRVHQAWAQTLARAYERQKAVLGKKRGRRQRGRG